MINEIKKDTKLYRKELVDFNNGGVYKYEEVKVYDIYLEKYISGWKTIIKVITNDNILFTHFASDLNSALFIEIPNELKEGENNGK